MADELERRGFHAVAGGDTCHHADPAIVPASAMAGVEREAAEPIEDRPPPVDLHGERIMRTVSDHDLGARRAHPVRDPLHPLQDLLAEPPMPRPPHPTTPRPPPPALLP